MHLERKYVENSSECGYFDVKLTEETVIEALI